MENIINERFPYVAAGLSCGSVSFVYGEWNGKSETSNSLRKNNMYSWFVDNDQTTAERWKRGLEEDAEDDSTDGIRKSVDEEILKISFIWGFDNENWFN